MPPNVATMLAAAAAALTARWVVLRGRGNSHSASNGEEHEIEDPEAIGRTGLVPVSVAWDNIHCVVRDKAGNVVRCYLHFRSTP